MKNSITDLWNFLDCIQENGHVSPETVKSWRYTLSYVQDLLPESAKQDVLTLTDDQINAVVDLYCNSPDKNYDPKTIAVYKSRLRISLAEYKKYIASPGTYSYHKQPRTTQERIQKFVQDRMASSIQTNVLDQISQSSKFKPNGLKIPVAIRPDLIVEVVGIPTDLTKEEVDRITRVLIAYST